MQYIMLIYETSADFEARSNEKKEMFWGAWCAYHKAMVDAGVYVTDDGGTTWRDGTGNLPPSMVVDLVYHSASKTLLAATYGRSIWRLHLP